jgi:Flp pilus assembly pilin Flp
MVYLEKKGGEDAMRFLKDQQAIETAEVAVIMAVVVLVAYGAYQLLGARIAEVVRDIAGRL